MSEEFYLKYRPKLLKHVFGQEDAVKTMIGWIKRKDIPHAIMFTGPSGTGKTTLARILKNKLNCGDGDYEEINAAQSRGIDTIREIDKRVNLSAISGDCRIWLLDEAHSLSSRAGGNAQEALLKVLEERPEHVYFFLCTTDPKGLLDTIHSRCAEVKLVKVNEDALKQTVDRVLEGEGLTISDEVKDKLVEVADGCPRKVLVLLHQIVGLENEEDQLNSLVKADSKRQAIEIARQLMNPKTTWAKVAPIIKYLKEVEEVETIRHMMLSYCTSVMLNQEGEKENPLAARAAYIVAEMVKPYYDSKWAGFISTCYEILRP